MIKERLLSSIIIWKKAVSVEAALSCSQQFPPKASVEQWVELHSDHTENWQQLSLLQ